MNTYLKPLIKIVKALVSEAGSPLGIRDETAALFHDTAETVEHKLLNRLLELPDDQQAERFVRIQVQQLVELDDRLFTRMGAEATPHVDVLRAMVRRMAASVPNIDFATLPLPEGVFAEFREVQDSRLATITAYLRGEGVEEALVQTIGLLGTRDTRAPAGVGTHNPAGIGTRNPAEGGARELFAGTRVSRVPTLADHRYGNRLLGELEGYRFIPLAKGKAAKSSPAVGRAETASTQLMHLLIQCGYNNNRFHYYCTRHILHRLRQSHSKEGRLAILDEAAQTFRALKPLGAERYAPELEPIHEALLAWIAEETERVKLDDTLVDTEAEYHRIQLNLNVHEEAILAKLFYDEGLVAEENLEVYARKLAFHFSSKEREVVSGTSLRAKMTTNDQAVLHTVRRMLEKMVARVERML